MQSLKISKYLGKDEQGNDEFVLTVLPAQEWNGNPTEERIKVAHDYVEIFGECSFELLPGVKKPESQNCGASNWLSSRASIQISIRDMFSFILPYLNKHKYLQPEHFKNRTGESHPPYTYEGGIIHYIDNETDTSMTAFRRVGESIYNHITSSVFQTIKDTLRLSYRDPEEFNG